MIGRTISHYKTLSKLGEGGMGGLRRLQQLLLAPTDALPLDLFRIAVGLLAVAYLVRAAFEAPYFSSPDGLIDHELSEKIFPYTIQPLFRPWMTIGHLRTILGVSCLLAFGIVFGTAPRICAFVLYLVALLSGYKSNRINWFS